MDDLFGRERADAIRKRLEGLNPDKRETLIMNELSNGLGDTGAKYVLRFGFKNVQGTRTKHYLIFASKNFRGYEIMRDIMAKESSELDQGVASFSHVPASGKDQLSLRFAGPIDELGEMLLAEFAGQKLTMRAIYERHSVGRPYVAANYKRALLHLESIGKIEVDPPAEKRPKRKSEVTMADDVVVTFPRGAKQ